MSNPKRNWQWRTGTPQAVLDLWHWQKDKGDSFNCRIFELMGKADRENRLKLLHGWPDLFAAWCAWHLCDNGHDFFAQYREAKP
jgi:surfactin synthase thioesterase subunit